MLLTFLVICFAGLAFMFFCIQAKQEKMLRIMQEEHAQIRLVLRALEAITEAKDEEPSPHPSSIKRQRTAPPLSSSEEAEDTLLQLKGTTVAEAAALLHAGRKRYGLEADEAKKAKAPMPDLSL